MHVQETLACPCGAHVVTAEGPRRPLDKCQYGASFIAHLVTMKCGDALPLHRLEKHYKRIGVPVARSTMTDLFHGAAEKLVPLYNRLMALIAAADLVQADETPLRVQAQKKTRKGYLWTFLAGDLIGFRFSPSRSGETPRQVLGATNGTLVVDGYTGYNAVCVPDSRTRAGCWSHVRRKFFDARTTAPEANQVLDHILELFRVEREAADRRIVGSEAHLTLRQTRSSATLDVIKAWLDAEQPKHLPQGAMGKAIGYAQNQWAELNHFLTDARIPIHNNSSERALRSAALGRKNFLFVGHDDAGQNTAVLYSLVATCEAHGVSPLAYLADVLLRLDDHPAKAKNDPLPHRWKPPNHATATEAPQPP